MTNDCLNQYPTATALYIRVAETIRAWIEDGTYPPGSVLPSERELIVSLGVSRDSLRAGLADLRQEGLIESRRGFPPRVRSVPDRILVYLAAGQTVTARMPTHGERLANDIPQGVPVLIVDGYSYRADTHELIIPT